MKTKKETPKNDFNATIGNTVLSAVSDGKSFDEKMAELCEECEPKLWGEKYPKFIPRVCKKKLGDGKQLIWFQTLDQRPYWWWVLIDSKTNVSSDDFDPLEIYDLIEDEFGAIPDEGDEDYDEEVHSNIMDCYPMIVPNDGITWGKQELFRNSR